MLLFTSSSGMLLRSKPQRKRRRAQSAVVNSGDSVTPAPRRTSRTSTPDVLPAVLRPLGQAVTCRLQDGAQLVAVLLVRPESEYAEAWDVDEALGVQARAPAISTSCRAGQTLLKPSPDD